MNIFNIEQNLLSIFQELEENGGELTDELATKLAISENDLKDKVEAYVNVIKTLQADINLIDAESKRLSELKKTKKNNIERLNKILITVIDEFGDTSKSGAKYIDYNIGKVSIRKSQSVEVEEDAYKKVPKLIFEHIETMKRFNQLDTIDVFTKEHLIDTINSFEDLNIDRSKIEEYDNTDLSSIKANISFNISLSDLEDKDTVDFIKQFINKYKVYNVEGVVNKTELKTILKDNELRSAKIVTNKNLTIK